MRHKKVPLLAVILLLSLSPAGVSHAASTSTGDAANLSVQLEVQPNPALVGVPILLRVTIVNDGADDVAVDLSHYRERAFSISIMRSTGEIIPGGWRLREGMAPPSRAFVPSRGRYTQYLIVDRWLKIDAPTVGTMLVDLDAGVFLGGSEPFFYDAREAGRLQVHRELSIEVVADAAKAEEFCATLSNAVQRGAPAEILPQLEALAFVRAPSCIPELKEAALHATAAQHLPLDGIANIGGRIAVTTLLEMLGKADAELQGHLLLHLRRFCADYPELVSPALKAAGRPGCTAPDQPRAGTGGTPEQSRTGQSP